MPFFAISVPKFNNSVSEDLAIEALETEEKEEVEEETEEAPEIKIESIEGDEEEKRDETKEEKWALIDITHSQFSQTQFAKNRNRGIFHIQNTISGKHYQYYIADVSTKSLGLLCVNGHCKGRINLPYGKPLIVQSVSINCV